MKNVEKSNAKRKQPTLREFVVILFSCVSASMTAFGATVFIFGSEALEHRGPDTQSVLFGIVLCGFLIFYIILNAASYIPVLVGTPKAGPVDGKPEPSLEASRLGSGKEATALKNPHCIVVIMTLVGCTIVCGLGAMGLTVLIAMANGFDPNATMDEEPWGWIWLAIVIIMLLVGTIFGFILWQVVLILYAWAIGDVPAHEVPSRIIKGDLPNSWLVNSDENERKSA